MVHNFGVCLQLNPPDVFGEIRLDKLLVQAGRDVRTALGAGVVSEPDDVQKLAHLIQIMVHQAAVQIEQDVELTHHKGLPERMDEAQKRVRRLNGQREKNADNSENRLPFRNPNESYDQ